VGTIRYYKNIENEYLRDQQEGQGPIVAKFDTLSASTFNRIFPDSGLSLNAPWKIQANGCKIIDDQSTFNAFVFCMSMTHNPSAAEAIKTKLNKGSVFYLKNISELSSDVSKKILTKLYELNPTLPKDEIAIRFQYGDVQYSDHDYSREVNENNYHKFNPRSVSIEDLFTKPRIFKEESEIRIIFSIYNKRLKSFSSFAGLDFIDIQTDLRQFSKKKRRCRGLNFNQKG